MIAVLHSGTKGRLDQFYPNPNFYYFTGVDVPDAAYLVPSTDLPPGADAARTLFYIADDHARMVQRVARLNKKSAHSE